VNSRVGISAALAEDFGASDHETFMAASRAIHGLLPALRSPLGITALLTLSLGQLLVWGGSGTVLDLVRGQLDPGLESPPAALHLQPGTWGRPGVARVEVGAAVERVAPEYLSIALDAAQLVGGAWWDPAAAGPEYSCGSVPVEPIDLERPGLAELAGALAPAFLRVGGSESDRIHYGLGSASPSTPPGGQHSVLTQDAWDDLDRFVRRADLKLVFTLNAGPGARDRDGGWVPDGARRLLEHAGLRGTPVALWELGNELNGFWAVHRTGRNVPARQYARDLAAARELVEELTPSSALAGQGAAFWPVVGEPLGAIFGVTRSYLDAAGDLGDAVVWHYYPQQSRRGPVATRRATPTRLLVPENLEEAAHWAGEIARLRDRDAPGRPIWLGETGNAQFGGEPGVSDTYLSSLWWLDQLGRLALEDVDVQVRQTLVGMDYGLVDDRTLTPRPDYWVSLAWKRCMGEVVREAHVEGGGGRLRAYAHDAPTSGEVGIVLLNLDPTRPLRVELDGPARALRFESPDLYGQELRCEGRALRWAPGEGTPRLPDFGAVPAGAGVELPPLGIAFVLIGD
jgi:heparanase 1